MNLSSSAHPWALFGTGPRGVLATLKRDGRPQLSNIGYRYDTTSREVLIPVTDTRAKTHNLRRDPRASLYVSTPDLGAYVVGEGRVELSPVTVAAHDTVADQLVAHYRASSGEHPDWDEFRAAMVNEQRLLVRLPLVHAYGWDPNG